MARRAFACPKCKQKLVAPEGVERFRCPHCKTVLTAPSSAPAPQPQPPPAPQPTPQPPAPAPQTQAPAPPPDAREPEAQEQLEGESLGGYRITRKIGSGGMGTVYEAIQEGLRRRVALKVLPRSVTSDTAFLTSFKREAQAAAKLNHPNIIQIFDIVEDKGFHFFSMELVDGESLDGRIEREGRITVVDALQIVAQVATALDHANENLLIHRDVKPSNILLTQRGDVKLADLGLSKSLEETTVGIVRGTHGGPVYMAPELARNPQIADCRSDIYSLGVVLYHMLTGRPPFPGPTVADLIKQHAHSPLPSARALAPELPQEVDDLLARMCAKDPAERFQTYEELLSQFQLLLKATSVRHARIPAGAGHRPPRRGGRRRWLPVVIIAGVLLAGLAAAAALLIPTLFGPPEQTARPATDVAAAPATGDPAQQPAPTTAAGPTTATPTAPATQTEPEGIVPTPPEPGEPNPPDEGPKEPEPPPWEAALAEAEAKAKALSGEQKFGEAIAAIEAVAAGQDNEALKAKVAEARAAIEAQAAQAADAARTAAARLAGQGKLDEAAAAVQKVADTFGTDREVQLARAAIAAIQQYRQGLQKLATAAKQAASAAQAAERRAAQQAQFAEAWAPIEGLLGRWQLAEAVAKLDALQLDDPAVRKQVAQRRAAAQALIALQGKMIQRIKTAQPRLRKSDLIIPGLNGDLVSADRKAITAKTPMKTETVPWPDLRAKSARLLVQKAGDSSSPQDLLGAALMLRLLGDEDEAGKLLTRAAALGAKTDALGDLRPAAEAARREADAAKALASALRLAAAGQHAKAAAALDSYQEKFADTRYFASAGKLYQAATAFKPFALPAAPAPRPKPPGPKPPVPKPKPKPPARKSDPKAVALYRKAAEAYRRRELDACRKHLDELRAQFPKDPVLANARLKPTVPAMLKAVASKSATLTVGPGGRFRTLAEAIEAVKQPNATIEVRAGRTPYADGASIGGESAQGLTIRGTGERNPRFTGPATILKIYPDTKDVWVGGLSLQGAEIGLHIYERCSVTLRDIFARDLGVALKVHADTTLDIANSVLKINALNAATIESTLVLCGDTSLDYSKLRHCVLVGKDIGILNSQLTDCLILGSVRLRDKAVLDHVTLAGTVTIERDIRGARITDSILPDMEFQDIDVRSWNRRKKDQLRDEALNVTVTNSLLYSHRGDLPQILCKGEALLRGKAPFRDPARHDFRLPDGSPLATKGAKGTPLGCRFTDDLLKLLRYVPR